MKVFEGLPTLYRTSFLVFFGYTSIVAYWGRSVKSSQNAKEKQEFIEYYRDSGHYKHPWEEKKTADVPEHVKKTDYTQVVANPQGIRYLQFGHRV